MTEIHVDPEELERTARQIWQINLQMSELLQRLRISGIWLEMAWQGGSAEEFSQDLESLTRRMGLHLEELERLGRLLNRQSEQWQASDQHWRQEYTNLLTRRKTSP